ncbi:hypothetical protein cpu_03480 [Carboxydothermus pertinax]|uniref:Uncharacterized protein n=1 Tax=Carboxydothermus pertinax TaxID=870242 RepID=A0A1L8CSD8_9THEO|nr:hypothetical protein cpu_03480 [Carboxydothermus pertinax]
MVQIHDTPEVMFLSQIIYHWYDRDHKDGKQIFDGNNLFSGSWQTVKQDVAVVFVPLNSCVHRKKIAKNEECAD